MDIMAKKKVYIIIACCLMLVLTAWTGKQLYEQIHLDFIGAEFITYWSSGHLLLNGENPYSQDRLMMLQQSKGWTREKPLLMYNLPSAMIFVFPFCIGDYRISKLLWMFFVLFLIIASTHLLWSIYGGREKERFWSLLVLGSFMPAYFMALRGQSISLVLMGVVGFLYYMKREKYLIAAIFTALIAIKPHVTYLFWVALLLWSLHQKKWAILMWVFLTNVLLLLIPMIFNPHVYEQYVIEMMNMSAAYIWVTPTTGTFLRSLFGWDKQWLQHVPMVAGFLWFSVHWHKRRDIWAWDQETPTLLFVSLLTTVYCWASDFSLLIIMTIQVAIRIAYSPLRMCKAALIATYLFINGLALAVFLIFKLIGEHNLIWFVPSLFLWYCLALRTIAPQMVNKHYSVIR
jgi:hypothetical protein